MSIVQPITDADEMTLIIENDNSCDGGNDINNADQMIAMEVMKIITVSN